MKIAPQMELNILSTDLDAANIEKLTDMRLSTKATNGTQSVEIVLGILRQNAISMSGLVAEQVNITLYDYADTILGEQSFSQLYADIGDIWEYFYASFLLNDEFFFRIDRPEIIKKIKIVVLHSSENVEIGNLLVSEALSIGRTQTEFRLGIKDYSIKTEDEFGDPLITERGYAKKGSFTVWVDNAFTNRIYKYLSEIRAQVVLFIADDVGEMDAAVVFGIYRDFEILYTHKHRVALEIQIEQIY
ncbi:MAG: hypothetical protein AB7D43_06065 [Sulfurimonadaceae bacterium]